MRPAFPSRLSPNLACRLLHIDHLCHITKPLELKRRGNKVLNGRHTRRRAKLPNITAQRAWKRRCCSFLPNALHTEEPAILRLLRG